MRPGDAITRSTGNGHGPARSDLLDWRQPAPGSGPPGGTGRPGPTAPTPRRRWYRRPSSLVAGVVALVIVASVIVDLPQHSSPGQQAAGITSLINTINSDVHPCTYAVSTAFSIYRSQAAGQLTSAELARVPGLLQDDASACTLTDQTVIALGTLTLPGTAAGRDVGTAIKWILDWETEDAVTAIDALEVLHAHPGNAAAQAKLATSEQRLSSDRAGAKRAARAASRELGGADIGSPALPQLPRLP